MDTANLKKSYIVSVFLSYSEKTGLLIIMSTSKSIISSVNFNDYSTCFSHGGNITDCDFHENL